MVRVEITMASGKKYRASFMDDATINLAGIVKSKGWHLFEVGPMAFIWLNLDNCESIQMVTDGD